MGIALCFLSSWLCTRLGKPFVWAMRGYVSQGNTDGLREDHPVGAAPGAAWGPGLMGLPYVQKWEVSV